MDICYLEMQWSDGCAVMSGQPVSLETSLGIISLKRKNDNENLYVSIFSYLILAKYMHSLICLYLLMRHLPWYLCHVFWYSRYNMLYLLYISYVMF